MSRFASIVLLLLVSGIGQGEYIVAPMQHADWQNRQSKTLCQLLQTIDRFGKAGFLHHSGEPLQFFLQDERFESGISRASLFVEPAPWRDNLTYRQDYRVFLEDSALPNGQRLVVFSENAEHMLNSLLQGHYPVFSFIHRSRETRVAVSAINFFDSYAAFADCRKGLFPFNEQQLEQGNLYFPPGSSALSPRLSERLRQISVYLQEIKRARVSIVSATAVAGKADRKWFDGRAQRIVKQLQQYGVAKKRIGIEYSSYRQTQENDIMLKVFGPDALTRYYFRKGSTRLSDQEKQRLKLLAQYIQNNNNGKTVFIGSHTDSKGKRASNLTISQQRGDVVKDYLAKLGVDPGRLVVRAYGESKPIRSNRFPSGRAQNRRVVITFTN